MNILNQLNAAGFDAYAVGGCVRDMLLGRKPNDWDICSSAEPAEVMALFKNSHAAGIKHGTVTVNLSRRAVEITTFRTDGAYTDKRHPDSVQFVREITEDLSRRDFTVNAMAMDVSGKITDPFDGQGDLEKRLLRCVGNSEKRFSEDALRMLRAFRFSAKLGFELEEAALKAIYKLSGGLKHISIERIRDELFSVLNSNRPEIMREIIKTGLLAGIVNCAETPSFSKLRRLPKRDHSRLCGFCAILGDCGILEALNLNRTLVKQIKTGVLLAQSDTDISKLGYKRTIAKYGEKIAFYRAVSKEATGAGGHLKALRFVLSETECKSLSELNIKGGDLKKLGFSGKALGGVLNALLEHVLENPHDNNNELLIELAKDMMHVR